ncbi:MAG: hypothetical protein A3F72_17760 [Bacteroidetes bacterium RIFCSPLOWO2_12_FULL_35_15]|nr:MAG: hypothetical protein A3F72_17760 [Bacteroidetes bacterium RIFCSPLOWO2_12_FULL_35_15]
MKTNLLNLKSDNLIMVAQYLIYGELHNVPYKIKEKPIFRISKDGSFEYREPYFEYVVYELPHIFPEDWIETSESEIIWVLDEEKGFKTSIEKFFGLSEEAFLHLLMPGRQNIERFGGKILNNNSTHLDIAMNILEFVYKMNIRNLISPDTIFLN